MKTSAKITSLLAGMGVIAAALIGAAPASASGTGTTGGGASTICVEGAGAGVTVRVVETPAARASITQTVITGADGCASFAASGSATTSVRANALGRTGTVTYSPTVDFVPGSGLTWTDAVRTSGKVAASERTIQHRFAQADRVGFALTITR